MIRSLCIVKLQSVFAAKFVPQLRLPKACLRRKLNWLAQRTQVRFRRQITFASLGEKFLGEKSGLALEFPECLIILDDYKARKTAERLKLNVTGTIGVLIKAKRNGIIHSIRPILDKISQTNFRLSNDLVQEALYLAGELK